MVIICCVIPPSIQMFSFVMNPVMPEQRNDNSLI